MEREAPDEKVDFETAEEAMEKLRLDREQGHYDARQADDEVC